MKLSNAGGRSVATIIMVIWCGRHPRLVDGSDAVYREEGILKFDSKMIYCLISGVCVDESESRRAQFVAVIYNRIYIS